MTGAVQFATVLLMQNNPLKSEMIVKRLAIAAFPMLLVASFFILFNFSPLFFYASLLLWLNVCIWTWWRADLIAMSQLKIPDEELAQWRFLSTIQIGFLWNFVRYLLYRRRRIKSHLPRPDR